MATNSAIETEVDGAAFSAAAVAMLAALVEDEAVPGKRGPKVKVDLASMSREEELAHKAAIRRRNYQRKMEMKSSGSLPFNETTVRDVLADAALMLLASGAEGSAAIQAYLTRVYHDKGGVPSKVVREAKSGKLRPKTLGFMK